VKAVLVTRPGGAGDPLVAELEARGYRVIAVPTVFARPVVVDWPPLERFDWIVLTSAAGVEALPGTPSGPRWAAVGQSTARALRKRGVDADLIPAESNGVALGEALSVPEGARVLLVRASAAAPDLPATLRRRGAEVVEVTAYETIEGPDDSRDELLRALTERDLAAVVFASGSAVRGFVELGGTTDLPAITIGPRTSAVAREIGFRVTAEAAATDVLQLADAVERAIPIKVGNDA
jgi:uroporphyrinogen III methyltransferase/synthase